MVAPPDQANSPPCGNIDAVIERLTDMPTGTVGFRAAGEIEREDYDQLLVPELHRALEAGGGLRTLYLIEHLRRSSPVRWGPIPSSGSTSASGTTRRGFARRSSRTSSGLRARRDCSRG
jgi:hypothetical protein